MWLICAYGLIVCVCVWVCMCVCVYLLSEFLLNRNELFPRQRWQRAPLHPLVSSQSFEESCFYHGFQHAKGVKRGRVSLRQSIFIPSLK